MQGFLKLDEIKKNKLFRLFILSPYFAEATKGNLRF